MKVSSVAFLLLGQLLHCEWVLADNQIRGFRATAIEQTAENDVDMDGKFWDRYLQTETSVSDIPSSSPTAAPVAATVDPTASPVATPPPSTAPVATTTPPTTAPVAGTAAPTTAPVAGTAAPTTSPVAGTAAPTTSPVAGTAAPTTSPVAGTTGPTTAPVAGTAAPTTTPGAGTTVPTTAPVAGTSAPTAEPQGGSTVPTAAPVGTTTSAPTTAPIVATGVPTTAPVLVTGAPTVATAAPVTPPPTGATLPPTPAPVVTSSPTVAPVVTATPAPTLVSQPPVVQQRLTPYALQGGAEFANPESYQSKALARTEEQIGVESFTDAKLVQYYSLYCIYNATNQVPNPITESNPEFQGRPFPEWFFATGWETNNLDPCDGWFGVTCDAEGRVTDFVMVENLMTGAFPPEVTLLASDGPRSTGAGNLNYLELFNNPFLFNNFDNSWITELGSNLQFLYLGVTGFAGDLPILPTGLIEVDFAFCLIDGGLSDAVFQPSQGLEYVNLGGNAFNATVPTVFGSLAQLEFFYISDCFISGDLSYMQGMPKIFEHWNDVNPDMTGPVFDFIGSLSTLQSFSVTQSSLTGALPTSLGQLVDMQQMWYYANLLTGQIPTELGLLRRMATLQLEGNSFTGAMPDTVCANTGFLGVLDTLGADCLDPNFVCACCTCCSVQECNPSLF